MFTNCDGGSPSISRMTPFSYSLCAVYLISPRYTSSFPFCCLAREGFLTICRPSKTISAGASCAKLRCYGDKSRFCGNRSSGFHPVRSPGKAKSPAKTLPADRSLKLKSWQGKKKNLNEQFGRRPVGCKILAHSTQTGIVCGDLEVGFITTRIQEGLCSLQIMFCYLKDRSKHGEGNIKEHSWTSEGNFGSCWWILSCFVTA